MVLRTPLRLVFASISCERDAVKGHLFLIIIHYCFFFAELHKDEISTFTSELSEAYKVVGLRKSNIRRQVIGVDGTNKQYFRERKGTRIDSAAYPDRF